MGCNNVLLQTTDRVVCGNIDLVIYNLKSHNILFSDLSFLMWGRLAFCCHFKVWMQMFFLGFAAYSKSNTGRVIAVHCIQWFFPCWLEEIKHMQYIKTNTLTHRNTHTLWIFRGTVSQWNSVDIIRMESQVESPLSNCLVKMIITQQYLGRAEESDRVRVKRAHLLYEDYSSKFDSCSQPKTWRIYEFKCLLVFPYYWIHQLAVH